MSQNTVSMMECDEPIDQKAIPENPVYLLLGKEQDQWLQAILQLKRLVIGSNRQKDSAIESGVVPRLLQWMMEDHLPQELRTEASILLGSLAFGVHRHIQHLVQDGAVSVLIRGLESQNLSYVEACLRCLRTIFIAPNPPVDLVYQDQKVIRHLLNIIHQTTCTKETISNIFANACNCLEHQTILLEMGAIPALAPLLGAGTLYKIQMPILKFFAHLCHGNKDACDAVGAATVDGEEVVQMIRRLQSRDKTSEMQMAAAKCLTYLYRGLETQGSVDDTVVTEVLHTLVRMCKKDRTLEENVEGAETLAYLIKEDPKLQSFTAICDHSIKALAEYLSYTEILQLDARQTQNRQVDWSSRLKAAAFQAFAAIAANNEELRKKIIQIDSLMGHVVVCMENGDVNLQTATLGCLLSLTRSVQQLRTNLRDHMIWEPLIKLMRSPDVEVVLASSAVVCNLLTEFSPSKDEILEFGALKVLKQLCQNTDDFNIRLNGVWALMNLTHDADHALKLRVVQVIGVDLLVTLMRDSNPDIRLRTLGLLRNLLAKKHHIDNVMAELGTKALQAVAFILSDSVVQGDKEQALCVLANIADGPKAKTTLLNNEEVMAQVISFLHATEVIKLQTAAVCVVKNLLAGDDDDTTKRMEILRDRYGVLPHLQRLEQSTDIQLQERAKSAVQHFKKSAAP